MNGFILGQLFGILGAIATIISSIQKKRKSMMIFLIFDPLFYTIQYILLNAYAGVLSNIIGVIRTVIFSFKGKTKFFNTNYPLYIILFLYLMINVFTYKNLYSIFPIIASIVYACVLWQDNPKNIRKGSLFMFSMWFIYNLVVKAYVGMIVELILLTSTIISICKLDCNIRLLKRHRNNEGDVKICRQYYLIKKD